MPDQGREAMSDIISAKCFGCGHIVKVPSALGGKKARCPKCTNTIVIPALSETSDEIVTDDQLPEVARDDEVLEGELIEPDEESGDSAPRPESMREKERVPSGAHRRAAKEAGASRSGTRMQGARPPATAKSSGNTGLIVGVVVGLLVVGGIVVAVAMKPPKTDGSRAGKRDLPKGPETGTPKTPQDRTPADDALETRCREYINAFNRGNVAQAARFYEAEPGRDLTQAVGRLLGGAQYKGAEFKKTSAAEGVTTFVCEYVVEGAAPQGKEITLRWKQVDGEWFIADRP
jgi:hypothetical protein